MQSRYSGKFGGCTGDSKYTNPNSALNAYITSMKGFLDTSDT